MTPQDAEELAHAAARVQALALKNGLSVEVRVGGRAADPFNVGTDVEALAEQAPPEARRAVLLRAVGRAWAAHPEISLGKLLDDVVDWTPNHWRLSHISDLDMLKALRAVMEAG